jgi:hypothetical protein
MSLATVQVTVVPSQNFIVGLKNNAEVDETEFQVMHQSEPGTLR